MSGGAFNHKQHAMRDIAEAIALRIQNNNSDELNQWGEPRYYKYPDDVITEFKKTLALLHECYERVHEIDYLLSADTGEGGFMNAMMRLTETAK